MHALILSLGTNLGNRSANIREACRLIEEQIGYVAAFSGSYQTRPVGFDSPNSFLNAAIEVRTLLGPEEILRRTQAIEKEMGRTQKSSNGVYQDRLIDIDILLYDDLILENEELCLPHPRIAERRFVLEPLCTLLPQKKHPLLGKTFQALLQELNQGQITALTEEHQTEEICTTLNRLLPQLSDSAQPLTPESLNRLLRTPATHIYLLRDETGEGAGMATLCIDQIPTGCKAWIEDVVVNRECRGRGYARQLIRHLLSQAQKLGAESVNLTSRPERVAANRLYQSEGFVKRETNVYRWKEER